MNKKSPSNFFLTAFKWLLGLVLLGLGCKVLLTILSALTVGVALATVAMWAVGAFIVSAGALFVTLKVLSGKRKS